MQALSAIVRWHAWEVVLECIDPASEEDWETVIDSFNRFEKLEGGGLVIFVLELFTEWRPDDVEASSFGFLNPEVEFGALDAIDVPISTLGLGFADMEDPIDPVGDGRVTSARAHAPSQHWIQTVQSDDADEIT